MPRRGLFFSLFQIISAVLCDHLPAGHHPVQDLPPGLDIQGPLPGGRTGDISILPGTPPHILGGLHSQPLCHHLSEQGVYSDENYISTLSFQLYEYVALWLVKFEQPRTQTDFEQSYTFKMFCFQFINFYLPLIYIAVIKVTPTRLYFSC